MCVQELNHSAECEQARKPGSCGLKKSESLAVFLLQYRSLQAAMPSLVLRASKDFLKPEQLSWYFYMPYGGIMGPNLGVRIGVARGTSRHDEIKGI
jgi:hypothetical protein